MISEYTLKLIELCQFLKNFAKQHVPKHSIYRTIELPSTLTMFISEMRNFKDIIMSEYTSKLTILRYFLKIFSKVNMPHKPISSVGFDTSNIFM